MSKSKKTPTGGFMVAPYPETLLMKSRVFQKSADADDYYGRCLKSEGLKSVLMKDLSTGMTVKHAAARSISSSNLTEIPVFAEIKSNPKLFNKSNKSVIAGRPLNIPTRKYDVPGFNFNF